MAKVLGIGGIFFKSSDPVKLGKWYEKTLHISLESSFNGAVFKHADTAPHGATIWSPFTQDTEYFKPSDQAFMFNFIVDDVDEILKQVVDEKGKSMGTSVEEGLGKFGWFIDPEGNKVEIWQPLQN